MSSVNVGNSSGSMGSFRRARSSLLPHCHLPGKPGQPPCLNQMQTPCHSGPVVHNEKTKQMMKKKKKIRRRAQSQLEGGERAPGLEAS